MNSSNMMPTEWQCIADDIKRNHHKYNNFIVLHGTDTMAYTVSALSFILENLEKLVIITISQIPLSEIHSDGCQNLLNSISITENYLINEITLFFNYKLYRATE